jgi:hypothetical protein
VYKDALLCELYCAPSVLFHCCGLQNPDVSGTLLTTSEGNEGDRCLVGEHSAFCKECAQLHLSAILIVIKQSLDRH